MGEQLGNIVLVGFMGSGKSTVSQRVARRLKWRLADTDRLVEERAGLGIPDIFASLGEDGFRGLETEALRSLAGASATVVATGGGIVLREENRELLRSLGFTVWLTASTDTLFERVSRNDTRPLLRSENPRRTLEQLLESRHPLYLDCSDCVIDSSELSHRAVVNIVIQRAGQYFGVDLQPSARRRSSPG